MAISPSTSDDRNSSAANDSTPVVIEGLFTLETAATILRDSASSLDTTVIQNGDQCVKDFFVQLTAVEADLMDSPKNRDDAVVKSYVIVVEGLDGSGKSSLVETLKGALQQQQPSDNNKDPTDDTTAAAADTHVVAWATPTASMKAVRPVFDKQGGFVARAFYMVSNFMLQYELRQLEKKLVSERLRHLNGNNGQQLPQPQKTQVLIVLVDRWYTSTVAYSVAWKNTQGGIESVNALDESIFAWPVETLRPPDLFLLLQVDHEVRRDRVQARNKTTAMEATNNDTSIDIATNRFNPWDERLNQDENLGRRIFRAFERVGEGLTLARASSTYDNTMDTTVVVLDANQSQQKVLQDALAAVQNRIQEHAIGTHPSSRPCSKARWTVAITGTHCAGKATVGRLLAERLGSSKWTFQAELGDILRETTALVAGGHRLGNGGGDTNAKSWDEQVYEAEILRDEESITSDACASSRVVETWHVGNLAWALFRQDIADTKEAEASIANSLSSEDARAEHVRLAGIAIQKEMKRRSVLVVHLGISPEDSVRRRRQSTKNSNVDASSRIPMVNELEECYELHQALDVRVHEELLRMHKEIGLPVLVLDNSRDDNIEGTVQVVIDYIHTHSAL